MSRILLIVGGGIAAYHGLRPGCRAQSGAAAGGQGGVKVNVCRTAPGKSGNGSPATHALC